MRILHQATGFFTAALLALNTASARAASEGMKAAPDAATAAAHAAAKGDGLLEALLTELERSQTQLKMNQVQVPYYIEYRVNEVEDLGIEAAFGALRENQHIHVRVLRVVVRVGDYKQHSYFARGRAKPAFCRWTTTRLRCAANSGWPPTRLTRLRDRRWRRNRRG